MNTFVLTIRKNMKVDQRRFLYLIIKPLVYWIPGKAAHTLSDVSFANFESYTRLKNQSPSVESFRSGSFLSMQSRASTYTLHGKQCSNRTSLCNMSRGRNVLKYV